MRNRRRGLRIRPHLDQLDDRCLLSGYSPTPSTGYTPAQITSAYGLNAITLTSSSGTTVTGNGSGETIAVIEAYHDPNLTSDLATFDQAYNLPAANLTVVNQAGSQTNSGWTGEESLDVEWAHAMAPGANILVVEARSQSFQDLLNAVNTARNTAGVNVISMSWGFSEMSNEASYDSYFTTPAGHVGITFIAASGDSEGVEYPAASPDVLSVGGTTLTLSSSGSYQSESAWSSSGGGYSQFEAEPSYQASVQTTGFRSAPDVAFDADPNTGVQVYETDPRSNQGSWQEVGGTSVGAPSWAGIIAIVDQGRALDGKGSLDGATQTLPTLYAAPSTEFHSITASSSSFPGSGGNFGFGGFDPFGGFGSWGFPSPDGYSFSAWSDFGFSSLSGATANTQTGLGSPNGQSLINTLVASNTTTPLTTITGSGQSGSGSGSGTAPTSPTQPTQPIGGGSKHHHVAKHPKTIKHAETHASKGSGHRLVAQKSATEKAESHHSRQ
jgi:subtilase family serine protease